MWHESDIPASDEDLYGAEGRAEEPTEQLVSFRLGTEWYGIRIASVREVVRVGRMTYLTSAPAHVAGIVNLRGNIVSVTDPARIFGLPPTPLTDQSRLLVIETQAAQTGLLVDEVAEVVTVPLSRLEPPLSTLDSERAGYIEHTCRWGERLMAILQVETLMGLAESDSAPTRLT